MVQSDDLHVILMQDEFTCRFQKITGVLESIETPSTTLTLCNILIDVGVDGTCLLNRLTYHSFRSMHTWELPPIEPLRPETLQAPESTQASLPLRTSEPSHSSITSSRDWHFQGWETVGDTLVLKYQLGDVVLYMDYVIQHHALCLGVRIVNAGSIQKTINGVSFLTWVPGLEADTQLAYPGNVPHNSFSLAQLQPYEPVQAGFCNPVIRTWSDGEIFDLIFIDEEEKWGTGVFKDEAGVACYVHSAAVESRLLPNESLDCGTLYVMPIGADDEFLHLRNLYEAKGWTPPTNGIRESVLYSCHPHGTMDAGFPLRQTLRHYTQELERLHNMGIDSVWLLPIFEHLDRGVYHPTDQSVIDARYGTDADVEHYVERAHELGMTVLFDYVPHGPDRADALATEHPEWISHDVDGEDQIEWNCVSFDMANPAYQAYTHELVRDHVKRFHIDGARIDCAMGGLSNWDRVAGNRASSSGLKGGVGISKAIREAFVSMQKRPLVTPENFHPVPFYAPVTDVFYDFPLYRALYELEEAHLQPSEYVKRLSFWLRMERLSSPQGSLKLRFLGNHDTVTWVWNKARATRVYGVNKAKALWVLMSTIDGIPMIYQGDEDASIYGQEGPNLEAFFKELFHARRRWLDNTFDIEYLLTETPILAFLRRRDSQARLVAINLSDETVTWQPPYGLNDILFGNGDIEASHITLQGFQYILLDVSLPAVV